MSPNAVLFLLALLGQQGLQDRKVDFNCSGRALPKLAAELSKAAGIPLEAPPVFGKDILIVRAKGASLKDLMDRIADIAAGEWLPQGNGYMLTLSQEKLRAQQAAEAEATYGLFVKMLDAEKKKLAQMHAWDKPEATSVAVALQDAMGSISGEGYDQNVWQRIQLLEERAPLGRAMIRVMANLDPKTLVDAPVSWKTVYSSSPTKMQRAMPPSLSPVLAELAKEQALWAETASKIITTNEQDGMIYSPGLMNMRALPGQLGKTLLIINKGRSYGLGGANIELVIADPKGRVLMRSNRFLSNPGMNYQPPQPQPGEQPLEISPVMDALQKAFEGFDGTPKPLPADVQEILLHPEVNEPIAYGTGEMLVKMAASRNQNLVAEIPDIGFLAGAFAGRQKMTPSMLFQVLRFLELNTKEDGGWLTLTPNSILSARHDRADRVSAGQFVRLVAKNGRASLDQQAAFAASFDGEMGQSIGFLLAMLIDPTRATEYMDNEMLRFYGQMSIAQRQLLASGRPMSLANLTAAELSTLNKMVYSGNDNFAEPEAVEADAGEDGPNYYGTLDQEPTERFGNGIPPDAQLTMSISDEQVLMAPSFKTADGGRFPSRGMSASEVAQVLFAKEKPKLMQWMQVDPNWDQLRFNLATKRTLSFTFHFGGKGGDLQKELQDYDNSASGPSVPFAQLPEDFRKKVDAELAQIREMYKNYKPGDLGGGDPPPPTPRRF